MANKNLATIRKLMKNYELDYLIVNATNEFLLEYNALTENSRYKISGFTGSCGDLLVTPSKVFLFVDGRYHIQADNEVDANIITVVKLQTGESQFEQILKIVPPDCKLGLFSKKNSQKTVELFSEKRKVVLINKDPLDKKNIEEDSFPIFVDTKLAGLSKEEKFDILTKDLNDNEILLVTDLDEISYIFNMRDFSNDYSAKIKGKAVLSKEISKLFTVSGLKELEKLLKKSNKTFIVDKGSINAYDYNLIKDKVKIVETSPIRKMKSKKNSAEISHFQDSFAKTDKSLFAIRKFINENMKLSEFEICEKLKKEFYKNGAKGLSFAPIVAKDENSALAHYSKSSKDKTINDGTLVLIDCGAYFDGGLATDITRVFVKGEPTPLHKYIYTLVLKAFLLAFNYPVEEGFNGYDIDKEVRDFFKSVDTKGFIFNHGLGHGIGINVHEYPPKLSSHEISKVPIEEGMCFTIEPGLYKEGEFGIRLENSCYFKDGKINSFVKMNFEKKLINFDMLTDLELKQLSCFVVE